MSISSPDRDEFYPPPDLKDILTAARNLRRVFTMHWAGDKGTGPYMRVMEGLEALQGSLIAHYREFNAMERALAAAASTRFTEKQRVLLRWLAAEYGGGSVYTALIDRMSEDLGIPRSTVRWNLRGLRETGLIRAGDRENKGIPVGLTEAGRLMAECLSAGWPDSEQI